MTPLLHIEVKLFYKAVLLIHSVHCLANRPIGCIPRENSYRCFTVYSEWRDHQEASEVCHREHINGKLAVIEDEATQVELTNLISRVHDLPRYYFWIGVKLELLEKWTWLDGTPYSDGTMLTFKQMSNDDKGHARLNKWQRSIDTYTWDVTTIHLNGVTYFYKSQALCECKTTDCITNSRGHYFNMQANRWFDSRNKCVAFGGDLAVLKDEYFSDPTLQSFVQENTSYFIGLSNVRVISSETESAINYTNWSARYPTKSNKCVAIYQTGEWITSDCSLVRAFICEYDINYRTTFGSSTVRVTESVENSESILKMTTENDATASNSEISYLILGGLVLLIIISVIIITAVVCHIRRKTTDQYSDSNAGLDSRNGGTLQGSGGSPGYSAISQQKPTSNIPDVCYSTSTGIAAYVDEGHQYAEVKKVRNTAPPVTAATGEEYANLPQTQTTVKDKKQPTAAAAKKKHKSSSSATAAAVAPAPVVVSGGTEYACILPSQQRQSSPSGKVVEQNEYELPSEPVEYATLE